MNELTGQYQWTDLMNKLLHDLHSQGTNEKSIREVLRTIPFVRRKQSSTLFGPTNNIEKESCNEDRVRIGRKPVFRRDYNFRRQYGLYQ